MNPTLNVPDSVPASDSEADSMHNTQIIPPANTQPPQKCQQKKPKKSLSDADRILKVQEDQLQVLKSIADSLDKIAGALSQSAVPKTGRSAEAACTVSNSTLVKENDGCLDENEYASQGLYSSYINI